MSSFKFFTVLVCIFIMTTTSKICSAGKLDYRTTEELTFRYFVEKQWDSVIIIGKEALKDKIDYFYLRFRIGVSYFNKQKYFPASAHLEKAFRFNSSDSLTQKYLYYSYINTNRREEASALLDRNHHLIITDLHTEAGFTFSSNQQKIDDPEVMGSDSVYGEMDVYGDNSLVGGGLSLILSRWFTIDLSYNWLNFSKRKYFQYRVIEDRLENVADSIWGKMYIWSFPQVVHDTNFSYHVNQHEFHLGLNMRAGGWMIRPAFHFVNVSYPVIRAQYYTRMVEDTSYYLSYDSSWHYFPFNKTGYTFETTDTSLSNYLASITFTKCFQAITPGISFSWSNLNGKTQYQASIFSSYYPFGNLKLYGNTSLIAFFEEGENRILFSQMVGGRINSWWWAEVDFMYGNYANANNSNGSIVYNIAGKINYKIGGNLIFLISPRLRLSLQYLYFQKEYAQYYLMPVLKPGDEPVFSPNIEYKPYQTQTIIGGIIWKL